MKKIDNLEKIEGGVNPDTVVFYACMAGGVLGIGAGFVTMGFGWALAANALGAACFGGSVGQLLR